MKTISILFALILFLFAGCGFSREASDIDEYSSPPDDYQFSPQIAYISLGDTFQLANFDVAIGDRIEFVSYGDARYLYIPVTIIDMRVDPQFYGESIWQLTHTTYYGPSQDQASPTEWRSPGTCGGWSLFAWRFLGNTSPVEETHIRLYFSGDGPYILPFNYMDGEWLVQTFVLNLDVRWPEEHTAITIENVYVQADEAFQYGNFQVFVGSDFTLDGDDTQAVGIHLFPAIFVNTGPYVECFSNLVLYRLNSNCGFPVYIPLVYFQGEYIPPAELPALAPGERIDFRIPVEAFVCENSAWYRSFRITERAVSTNGNILIRHYIFEIYLY